MYNVYLFQNITNISTKHQLYLGVTLLIYIMQEVYGHNYI